MSDVFSLIFWIQGKPHSAVTLNKVTGQVDFNWVIIRKAAARTETNSLYMAKILLAAKGESPDVQVAVEKTNPSPE